MAGPATKKEEKKEDPEQAKEAPAQSANPGGKIVLAIILSAANLGVSGFLVTRVLKLSKAGGVAAAAHEAAAEGKEEASEAEHKPGVPAPTVPLDPFLVNLNEPGSSRYLKASVEVEVNDAAAAEELKKSTKSIRDDLLRYLSSLSVADTLGEAAKQKIEKQMRERIDKEIGGKQHVRRLFFNEFMVQ